MSRYRLTLAGGESLYVAADDIAVDHGVLLFQRRTPPTGPENIRRWYTALALSSGMWIGVAKAEEGEGDGE